MTGFSRYREWAAAHTRLGGDLPDPPFFDFYCEGAFVESVFLSLRADIQSTSYLPRVSSRRRPGSIRRTLANIFTDPTKTQTLQRMDPSVRWDDSLFAALVHLQSIPFEIPTSPSLQSIDNKKGWVWEVSSQAGVGGSPLATQVRGKQK